MAIRIAGWKGMLLGMAGTIKATWYPKLGTSGGWILISEMGICARYAPISVWIDFYAITSLGMAAIVREDVGERHMEGAPQSQFAFHPHSASMELRQFFHDDQA